MLLVAVPTAVAAAASFGLASALQWRATKEVPATGVLSPRLLLELIRQPLWVLSTGIVVLGLALQVLALAFAPLALVQPLLVTDILFGTVFSAWLGHRRLDRQILLGASACAVGLAALLSLAQPSGGSADLPPLPEVLPLAVVLVAIVVGCLVVAAASRFSGNAHVAALAVATGVCYGVTAGLIKVVTGEIRSGGLPEMFSHPAFYVVCVIGPIGFLLSQHTFQQGVLIAPALAIITIVDPLVGIAIGVAWLGERLDISPPALAGEAISGVVVIAGVALLAHRGTQLRHDVDRQAEAGTGARSAG
ncbi:DMT family transporter [Pseudonocardia sp. K10HN5]|uniref:DMT family transporter n=2 Tax=Pseudonocardia acidicola TaxID=2724939 RepID=A0ABX1SFZ4_9PSEU|nr:DMT family transporter [Pseudonocardia acidicola]NMH99301.1 DMT family transporter [Pseudonocardia acidicola]